jgi:hypothetical protein
MGNDGLPSVRQLQRPTKAEDIIAQESRAYNNDCFSCKLVGTIQFLLIPLSLEEVFAYQ